MFQWPYILVVVVLHTITCEQTSNVGDPMMSQVQFGNETGKGLTDQQLKFFIDFANYASGVYGDNV